MLKRIRFGILTFLLFINGIIDIFFHKKRLIALHAKSAIVVYQPKDLDRDIMSLYLRAGQSEDMILNLKTLWINLSLVFWISNHGFSKLLSKQHRESENLPQTSDRRLPILANLIFLCEGQQIIWIEWVTVIGPVM